MKEEKMETGDLHLGAGNHLTIKSSYVVVMHDHLVLFDGDGDSINLDVEIKADLANVPDKWHATMTQMMTARYGGVVKCYDNTTKPFKAPPKQEKKWWDVFNINELRNKVKFLN